MVEILSVTMLQLCDFQMERVIAKVKSENLEKLEKKNIINERKNHLSSMCNEYKIY